MPLHPQSSPHSFPLLPTLPSMAAKALRSYGRRASNPFHPPLPHPSLFSSLLQSPPSPSKQSFSPRNLSHPPSVSPTSPSLPSSIQPSILPPISPLLFRSPRFS